MSTLLTRVLARSLAPLLLMSALPAMAADDAYPTKVIRMVVPYSAGGTGDLLGPAQQKKLSFE